MELQRMQSKLSNTCAIMSQSLNVLVQPENVFSRWLSTSKMVHKDGLQHRSLHFTFPVRACPQDWRQFSAHLRFHSLFLITANSKWDVKISESHLWNVYTRSNKILQCEENTHACIHKDPQMNVEYMQLDASKDCKVKHIRVNWRSLSPQDKSSPWQLRKHTSLKQHTEHLYLLRVWKDRRKSI